MTKIHYRWLIPSLIFLLVFPSVLHAGLFDNDEENWRRIFGEIKKINARLVSLEAGKLKGIETVQHDLIRQIEEIKNLIPDLQGTVEKSQSEMAGYVQSTNKKLGDIEASLKLEILKNLNQQLDSLNQQVSLQLGQQAQANEKFQGGLIGQFDQLKTHLAGDMDKFANVNKGFFQDMARTNSDTLTKVVEQLNAQNQTLDRVNGVIKSELIPAIIQENEKSRGLLLSEMTKANKSNQDAILNAFSSINAKNQKLVEILERSLKEGEVTRTNVELLSKNMGQTNDNVIRMHDDIVKLKDVMVQQIDSTSKALQGLTVQVAAGSQTMDQKIEGVNGNLRVADEKINKLAESFKGLHAQSVSSTATLASLKQGLDQIQGSSSLNGEKLNKLVTSSTEIATHTSKMNQSLQTVDQALHTIEGGLANVDLANQKLGKLIEILKTIATEQGKMTQVLAVQGEIKQATAQVLKTQTSLTKDQETLIQAQTAMKQAQSQMTAMQSDIKQSQEEIKRAQAQILKSQADIQRTQAETLKVQVDAKKELSDLSRKANVNISRNDAIRKTLADIEKKP